MNLQIKCSIFAKKVIEFNLIYLDKQEIIKYLFSQVILVKYFNDYFNTYFLFQKKKKLILYIEGTIPKIKINVPF